MWQTPSDTVQELTEPVGPGTGIFHPSLAASPTAADRAAPGGQAPPQADARSEGRPSAQRTCFPGSLQPGCAAAQKSQSL